MLCYRYMKFKPAQWSLEDGWFKTARPSELNDPFDCRTNFVGAPTDKVLWEYVDRDFAAIRARAIRANPELRKVNIGRKFLFERLRSTANWADGFTELMYDGYDAIQRLICFSVAACKRENADNLMWSHYAGNCTGVRIGFELNDSKQNTRYYLQHVNYEEKIPSVDLARAKKWPIAGEDLKDYFLNCIFTKDRSWEYEDEVRMIIPKNHPAVVSLFQTRWIEGRQYDFFNLPRSLVRSVDFGVRADMLQAKKLMDALRDNLETRHIAFCRAELRHDVYGYKYVRM